MLTSLFFLFTLKLTDSLNESKRMVAKGENAICLKEQIVLKKRYLRRMNSLNKKIRVLKLATLVPKTKIIAKASLGLTKKLQSALTIKYEANTLTNHSCKHSIVFFKNKNPFLQKGKIKRNPDESARYFKGNGYIFISSKILLKEVMKIKVKNNKKGKYLFQINQSSPILKMSTASLL